MPRKERPRTTTLYLPPPDQVADPQTSAAGAQTPPSLDVLLTAQQITHSRGQVFDIESFLSPSQREEYIALLSHDPEAPDGPEPDRGAETPSDGVAVVADGGDGAGGAGGADGVDGPDEADGESPSKRQRTSSSLMQTFWRQRIDKLSGRGRSATPRSFTPRSIKPEPDASAPSTPTPMMLRDHKAKDVVTAADRPEIQASASYWNHLLIQARAARGPQWDYNTQLLQFDQHSESYYSHGLPPPPTPPKPEKKKLPEPNGNADEAKVNGDAKVSKDKDKDKDKDREKEKEKKPSPAPSTPARPPVTPAPPTPTAQQQSPASGGGTPGRYQPGFYPSGPGGSPAAAGGGQSPNQATQLPPHLRMQAAAQANVQAQALALGQSGGFNLNPAMMHLQQQGQRPQAPGISPMALMGGMGGMQMGQMGMAPQQFVGQGGQGGGQAQGPMLAGWSGEQGFPQNR